MSMIVGHARLGGNEMQSALFYSKSCARTTSHSKHRHPTIILSNAFIFYRRCLRGVVQLA